MSPRHSYAKRVDANHGDIGTALRSIGCYVVDCSHVGEGFPDYIAGKAGVWRLIEVKDGRKSPSRRRLSPDQQIFHAEAKAKGCEVHVVKNEAEALALFGARISA